MAALERSKMRRESPDLTEAEEAWNEAQKALEEARLLPGGAKRIAALREAGKMRFRADQLRQAAAEEGKTPADAPKTQP